MPQQPSPWLKGFSPNHSSDASFIEYLRWMRVQSKNSTEDSGTILELFQKFENNDYSEALNRLTERTKKLAHKWFKVHCPWRIRVGGTKGVESMLLPAFDALGMPYIPSSTLKGIAREMAKQDQTLTESEIKRIFGDIEDNNTSMGQVTFLDAYPLPGNNNKGGLSTDMANSIWNWKEYQPPEYKKSNPNTCISLEKPSFIIGLRKNSDCTDRTFEQVRDWLINGLAQGIGARVNTGYGSLEVTNEELKSKIVLKKSIIDVDFDLEGQLIHGGQKFTRWEERKNKIVLKSKAIAEVRSVAFRCLLRYWFRCLALGLLKPKEVRDLELEFFGDIEPKSKTGLFRSEVTGKVGQKESTKDESGFVFGKLTIRHNKLSNRLEIEKKEALENILKSLTWLMFKLGGIGQGARRPCYKRAGNPPWRGSNLMPPNGEIKEGDDFWNVPQTLSELQTNFQDKLKTFYTSLATFSNLTIDYSQSQLKSVKFSKDKKWAEAIDKHCEIIICRGNSHNHKPFALSILHLQEFKIEVEKRRRTKNGQFETYLDLDYDPQLCGSTNEPSPVWIRQLNYVDGIDYQVVTVFGANEGKRKQFLDKLKAKSSEYYQVFPF
jgi:CRISPR-associated protein Cmr6